MRKPFSEEQKEEIKLMVAKELDSTMNEAIFNTDNKILTIIKESVRVEIKNAGVHRLIGTLIRQYVDKELGPIISEIIDKQITFLNRKLSREHQIAKDLSYSINAEIKHILMKAPISHTTEQEIKKKIMGKLNRVSNVKRLKW